MKHIYCCLTYLIVKSRNKGEHKTMKRLIQIGFDTLLLSIIPIIIWNVVGIIFEKDLANVFTLTYPIQFVFLALYDLFGSGANITAEKRKDKNIVYTNMIVGLFVGLAVVFNLILNCEKYLTFMNADYNTLKTFSIYAIVNMFYSFVLRLVLENLYYEKKNNRSNIISTAFNLANLLLFVILSLITKNQVIITTAVLTILGISLLIIFIKHIKSFKFNLKIKENILHSSSNIITNIAMFIIYFVGQYNEFSFGTQYIIVSNFTSLTTDAQWDMISSIITATHIDASKNEFNMKESLKNAYKYTAMLLISSVVMAIGLYTLYKPDLMILLITFGVQVIHMLICPICEIRLNYIQTKPEEIKTNLQLNVIIEKTLRILCSFMRNPYCTYIGQLFEATYLYIYTKLVSRKVKEIQ